MPIYTYHCIQNRTDEFRTYCGKSPDTPKEGDMQDAIYRVLSGARVCYMCAYTLERSAYRAHKAALDIVILASPDHWDRDDVQTERDTRERHADAVWLLNACRRMMQDGVYCDCRLGSWDAEATRAEMRRYITGWGQDIEILVERARDGDKSALAQLHLTAAPGLDGKRECASVDELTRAYWDKRIGDDRRRRTPRESAQ